MLLSILQCLLLSTFFIVGQLSAADTETAGAASGGQLESGTDNAAGANRTAKKQRKPGTSPTKAKTTHLGKLHDQKKKTAAGGLCLWGEARCEDEAAGFTAPILRCL